MFSVYSQNVQSSPPSNFNTYFTWKFYQAGRRHDNYKTLWKEIAEDTKKWKDTPCSWVGRVNIIKMPIIPRALYRFIAISIKIPKAFVHKNRKNNCKICKIN